MYKILVIYYTQTGQLKRILDSILSPLQVQDGIKINYLELKPSKPYPFPWKGEFFDCFPESVEGIPCEMEPVNIPEEKYDLVILGHQPWFLSPSIPIWSFLTDEAASSILKNKNVLTVIGARNMWCNAQEIVKMQLGKLNSNHIGNIVLQDKNDNIISAFTIIKWLIHGNKGPYTLLPEAGVSKKEIAGASKFGQILLDAISSKNLGDLQQNLISAKAVRVKFNLLRIESTARKIFKKFSGPAVRKGQVSKLKRKQVVKIFKAYLIFALFILSPIVSLIFMIVGVLFYPIVNKQLDYYKGISLKK